MGGLSEYIFDLDRYIYTGVVRVFAFVNDGFYKFLKTILFAEIKYKCAHQKINPNNSSKKAIIECLNNTPSRFIRCNNIHLLFSSIQKSTFKNKIIKTR